MRICSILRGALVSSLLVFAACDDNTSNLGVEVMPDGDFTISTQTDYPVNITSFAVDSILARTTTAYLGKFTDPYTNTVFESDFLTEFYCPEDFKFPDKSLLADPENPEARSVELNLYYSSYFGDSLAAQKLAVHELTRVLEADESYYTNLDPTQYYDVNQAPVQEQAYTAIDMIHGDSLFASNGVHMLTIPLPKSFGDRLFKAYYEHPEYYKNSEEFIRNVFKGFYLKHTQGDGSVLNINYVYLDVYFDYKVKSSTGQVDSLVTAFSQFRATPEIVQENRFSMKNIDQLIAQNNDVAYIMTPAGVFPEVELPIDEISLNDTINAASLTIYRKNNLNASKYQMGTPQELLMIPKSELGSFFEEQKVPDNITSYYTTLSNNQYTYSNITNLVNTLRRQRRDNPDYDKDPDWNKVVLVPITRVTQTTSSNTVITVRVLHDLSLNFAKLKKEDIKLSIIYSKYQDSK
ncbi:DUF4270 domain-containing protein [Bacteroides sp. Marseille-P3684]|uniref:DUF4270 domain-containing protein n=1 Tax=Bacteroides sp. Marseille-P3684 TaxID=2086579 RepID=UPI001300B077|nr:DUF4270 domain-containing protein [Bacteroides sp. Marseille-P3684]